jgi:hypothetical protein
MSPQIPSPADAADAPRDWARPILDRQLALLGRLAEAGLQIAVALERQATGKADADAPVISGDIALAYARAARAVRLTVALQSKLIADRQAFEAGVVKDRAQAAKDRDYRRIWDKPKQITRVEGAVWRIAGAAHPDDLETAEQLALEAGERLADEDLYGDILARPFSDIVADICRDLDLEPDWDSLSREAWAKKEIASGAIGAPLAAVLARDATSPVERQRNGGWGPRSGGGGVPVRAASTALLDGDGGVHPSPQASENASP